MALFFLLVYFLGRLLPDPLPPTARLYHFTENGVVTSIASNVAFSPRSRTFNWWLAKDGAGQCYGLVIEFPQGVEELQGQIRAPFRPGLDWTFRRLDEIGAIELPAKKSP